MTNGYGGTHQAIEDLALMRMIPELVVLDPCDASEIASATRAIADYDGPVYMRLLRGEVPVVLDENEPFTIGKAKQLRAGRDIGIVSTGFMTQRSLEVAAALEERGLSVGVLHVPTIKPFDTSAVTAFAAEVEHLVSAENHVTTGGLGSLVAEALFEAGVARPLTRIGLPNRYLECGSVPYLQTRYGITREAMIDRLSGLA